MYHQRQLLVFLLDLFSQYQRFGAVLAHDAAAHTRLDTNDKSRLAVDGLFDLLLIDIRHIGQFILP
ncbi:hypothetical protein D3C77_685030 [compost metagenome]